MEPELTLEADVIEVAGKEVELVSLKEDFRALETKIIENTLGDGISPLGSSRDFKGVPLQEAGVMRSACDQMKWAYDNTGLRYMPFFRLDFEVPIQGIEIWKNPQFDERGRIISGTLMDTIVVPITGGMDSDPTAQISRDMYLMIGMLLKHAYEQSQK